MKKIINGILIAGIMLSLVACSSSEESLKEPETVGEALAQDFHTRVKEEPEIGADELANALLENEWILFEGVVVEIEEGLLTGFGNTEITGFENGEMFSPMIGTIPFVGYVFEVSGDVDVEEFMTTLQNNADPRWNICTEAEETTIENEGNKVLFVMSPLTFEE